MHQRRPTDESDITDNLIDIRRYLDAHVRPARPARPPIDPSAVEAFRYAEYSDGRRPRFAKTDLILIGMVVSFAALIGALVIF